MRAGVRGRSLVGLLVGLTLVLPTLVLPALHAQANVAMAQAVPANVAPANPAPGSAAPLGSAVRPTAGSCAQADAHLVPSCGLWWGIWPRTTADGTLNGRLPSNVASLEAAVGRRFDLISRYKGWGEDIYDGWDVSLRDGGHLVLEDLTARSFATNTYTSWAQIAAGSHDVYLKRQALRAKAFGVRTFFSFNQEPEQAIERGQAAGTPQQFAAAYRHVRQVFTAAGATNVVWVWWMMGWSGHNDIYAQLWPGASYVDWIGYDPYDFNTCHRTAAKTAAATITGWYRWANAQAWSNRKPMMLAEYGSNGPNQRAWLAAVPTVLKGLPRVKAAVAFDSKPGGCDHRVTASAGNLAGFRAASGDPYVNPTRTR